MILNRRQMLGTCAATLGVASLARAVPIQNPKKVLFFTKSSGFQHSVVTRKNGEQAHAERIFQELAGGHNFEVTVSKDGRLFEPDQIGEWDAFAFYTTGDLTKKGTDGTPPMSPEGKRAFLDAVQEEGKGFIGMHCATDTFHSGPDGPSEYIRMIGGEFSGHGKQQESMIEVTDQSFPGVEPFGESFQLLDEWYAFRNLSKDLHVIMAQVTEGMEGNDYQRPNYPMTWSKMAGKGRVFYTSMGHREDVWTNSKYQNLLMRGLAFAVGRVSGDTMRNVSEVTPGYQSTVG